jgi:hypothetical protein
VLIAGVSTRAAAESAAKAGYCVTSLDAFGDLDQHPSVHGLSLPRDFHTPFTPHQAVRAARGGGGGSVPGDSVTYVANFENHPRDVGALAEGRALWGNPPAVLERVRNPVLVAEVLRARGLPAPAVRMPPDASASGDAPAPAGPVAWLAKPLSSGGGHRVRNWSGGSRPSRGCYLQQFIDGTPASIVFVAAGGRATALGVSRQLIGDPAFGADGYRYCGNILAGGGDPQFSSDAALVAAMVEVAAALTEAFGLVGVNGVDVIASEERPYTIEVNPRWCGSMELVERAHGVSVFAAHASACTTGALPGFDLVRARRGAPAVGKAIVFAREDVAVDDTRPWLADATVRDVPHPGERIAAGRPVCTVFAEGADSVACHAALRRRAEGIYVELAAMTRVIR